MWGEGKVRLTDRKGGSGRRVRIGDETNIKESDIFSYEFEKG